MTGADHSSQAQYADGMASTSGELSQPASTRIPRVRTPLLQRHGTAQKPPPGGLAKGRPATGRRSSSSAPSSRSSSPVPRPSVRTPNGVIDKKPASPLPVKRNPGSPVVKRTSAPNSPAVRRNSLPRNSTSPGDKPPSSPAMGRPRTTRPGVKHVKTPATLTQSGRSSSKERTSPAEDKPGKRVPTPMIQRKELGAYCDVPRNRSPIVSLTNKVEVDDGASILKAKHSDVILSNGDATKCSEDRSGDDSANSNKENRLSSSIFIKTSAKSDPTNSTMKSAASVCTSKLTESIPHGSNARITSSSPPSAKGAIVPATSGTVPLKQQFCATQNSNDNFLVTHVTGHPGHNERNQSAIVSQNGNQSNSVRDEASMDNVNRQSGAYNHSGVGYHQRDVTPGCMTPQLDRCYPPTPMDTNGYVHTQDKNMNQCPTPNVAALLLTSGYPYTPGTSTPVSGMHRTSMSMSLPILSNGHYTMHGKSLFDERAVSKHNNNNVKNLRSSSSEMSSKLTDVIPKNAGEELCCTDTIGDDSMFVAGMQVIYPDALELGGQGLCENCDDIKSPESPSCELVPTSIPNSVLSPQALSSNHGNLSNGYMLSQLEALAKSQSCPNLSIPDPSFLCGSPTSPGSLPQELVYEKYPPIRTLDVNKLEQYGEEQLREYYQYLQDTGNKNGWLSDSGQEVQRISVIKQLPTLLEQDSNSECMRRVVPKIREVLHVAQPDMQLAACSAFLQILQEEKVPLQNYTQTFLQTILNNIENRDEDVASAWMDTLLDVIDLLPKDIIKKDIMSLAIAKGQLSQSVHSRLCCCKILGKVATKFDTFIIKKDILPVVQSLCQDVDYEVRGCMCRQLDSVARGLGLEQTKSAILPELVELTNDEESFVRLAGLETVVSILSLLDDDTCTQTIVPLVCKCCQQAIGKEDSTLPVVSKQLGKLCHGLSVNLTEEQRRWFIEYYQKLCRFGATESKHSREQENSAIKPINTFPMFPNDILEETDIYEETRRNAGFNFPAMVMFAGVRHFKGDLFSSFHCLCSDSHYNVRKTVASGFHEVAKLLANNSSILLPEFINLMNDDSIDVLKGLISHLPESLEILIKSANMSNSDNKTHVHSDLIGAILSSEGVIFASNNWRLQEDFMYKLGSMSKCFTSEQIYQKFMPLLFRKLHTAKALPVKMASAQTTLKLMRHNRRLEQREEICALLVEELCRSDSCHDRSLFIDVCKIILDTYSRNFFKEYFFEFVLELTTDKVPNIRLRLCPVLPLLKTLLKLPGDRNLLQLLEQCARRLLVNEKDRDVMVAIDKAVKDMDKVEVQMESITKPPPVNEDLDDKRKAEEEKKLLELEEQDRKDEEQRAAKADKKKDGSKKDGPGSKIPGLKRGSKVAATSISKDRVMSVPSSRTERSSSFSGHTPTSAHNKNVKRSTSFNSE